MFYLNVSKNKNILFHKYINDQGQRCIDDVEFQPTLYKEVAEHLTEANTTPYRSLKGKILKEIKYDGLISYYKDCKKYDEIQYGIYGNISPIYQFIARKYSKPIEFDPTKIRKLFFDIEVEYTSTFPDVDKALYPITTIALYDSLTEEYVVLGYKPCSYKNYIEFEDEKEMLKGFLDIWESNQYPDMVVGWNSEKFDIPYLYNRLSKYKLGFRLSPIRSCYRRTRKDEYHKKYTVVDIHGIEQIDMMLFYKKYVTEPRKSHKLEDIGEYEVKSKKTDYSEYGNLGRLYEENYDLYVKYNEQDVKLMVDINKKVQHLELTASIAYKAKCNFSDVLHPTKSLDTMTYSYLLPENIIVEPKIQKEKKKYPGAYVKEPVPGLYKWILSIDFASMYPNIMRMLNIGPETIVEEFNKETCSKSPSGIIKEKEKIKTKVGNKTKYIEKEIVKFDIPEYYYDKTNQSVYSKMLTELFNSRVKAKKELKEINHYLNMVEHEIYKRELKC